MKKICKSVLLASLLICSTNVAAEGTYGPLTQDEHNQLLIMDMYSDYSQGKKVYDAVIAVSALLGIPTPISGGESEISIQTKTLLEAIKQSEVLITSKIENIYNHDSYSNFTAFSNEFEYYDDDPEDEKLLQLVKLGNLHTFIEKTRQKFSDDLGISVLDDYNTFHTYLAITALELRITTEKKRISRLIINKDPANNPIETTDQINDMINIELRSVLDHIGKVYDHIEKLDDIAHNGKTWKTESDNRFGSLSEISQLYWDTRTGIYYGNGSFSAIEYTFNNVKYSIANFCTEAVNSIYTNSNCKIRITKNESFYAGDIFDAPEPSGDFDFIYTDYDSYQNNLSLIYDDHKKHEYIKYAKAVYKPSVAIVESWKEFSEDTILRIRTTVDDDLDNYVETSTIDSDGDGLSDVKEGHLGTEINNIHSDTDGIPDGFEVNNGMDPLVETDRNTDNDSDGFSNYHEYCGSPTGTDSGCNFSYQSSPAIPGQTPVTQRAAILVPITSLILN